MTNKKLQKGGWHLFGKGASHLLRISVAVFLALAVAQPAAADADRKEDSFEIIVDDEVLELEADDLLIEAEDDDAS